MATYSNKPRPTCSKENQNYVTLDKLLKEVAEPVVRKRFDLEIHPAVLQKTLNRESSKIKNISQINRKQWNILFQPRSKDFYYIFDGKTTMDLISDTLPVPIDKSPGADISRIKYYRNELAHCNGKISDIEFEQQWVEICQAIVRLCGESYKEICAQLRVTSLSSGKVYGMKNIHQEIIEDWKEIEIKMIETNAIKELIKVTKKSNFIAVIGPSGCGKSTSAHQQFHKFLSENPVCRDLCLSLSDTESSPSFITAARGYTDIIKVLLDIGMKVNVRDGFDLNPLADAAGGGCFETVKLLLENNGDIYKQHKHKHFLYSAFA
ncbi:unnamed protein product [Mytilus coruscus]|uniref:DZIP3-like HEPN domain-containing protein n=1 Tax=Mytilus coruscus TaxID=42192 RepID=A0A6J8AJR1_MYTCO|nr:unnamed protein product [Mytilus coruscus]